MKPKIIIIAIILILIINKGYLCARTMIVSVMSYYCFLPVENKGVGKQWN
ncbi:MAG: hypothetical protein ACRDA5_01405 [Clostridium sp.]